MRALLSRTLTLLSSILLWSLLLALLLLTSAPGNRTVWNDWYTLLVEASTPIEELHADLTEEGGLEVLSLANAEAVFQGFPELERIPVSELGNRLDPVDPRFDPYLRSLPGFFSVPGEGRGYHLLLLRKDRPSRALLGFLRHRLGGGISRGWPATGEGWILVDALGANSLILALLYLLWSLGVLFFAPGQRLSGMLLLLSFLPAVVTGAAGAVASGLLFFALLHMQKASRRKLRGLQGKSYRRVVESLKVGEALPVLWSLLSVALLLLAAGQGAGVALRLFLSSLLSLGALLLVLAIDLDRYLRYEHHPFTPTSILTPRFGGRPPGPSISATIWGAGGLLTVVAVALLIPPAQAPPVPAPRQERAAVRGFSALGGLLEESRELGLPNVGAYVAHRAFQESISYGGGYRVPEEGESVALPTYDLVDGRLEESQEVVLRFDQQWLEETLENGEEYIGVHTVLLSQRRYTGVEQAAFDRLYLANFRPGPLAGAVLVAFSPFFLIGLAVARNFGVRSSKREA